MRVREVLDPYHGQVLLAIRAIRDMDLNNQACAYRFVFSTGEFVVMAMDDAQLEVASSMTTPEMLFETDVAALGEFNGRRFDDWWIGRNAQGYRDLVQLSFTDMITSRRHCVQLIGMPSIIDAYALDH